jgi:hypothetical protein
MRARNGIVVVAGLLAALAAGWWFGSPWWTLREMRAAAAAHDERALSAHVDYPALRASVKQQVMAAYGNGAVSEARGLGSLGAALARALAGPVIDTLVTPDGVRAMFEVEEARKTPSAAASAAGGGPVLPALKDRPVIERDGLDQFRVHGRDSGSATMIFRRAGLGWKLSGVALPPAR